ncbi:hypothetical protein U8V72_18255 [Priestia filamentosa]|uniref:hypothetical protein n=1 Tax=Priestia filamentosa TaxID=1402861 RepID=UPI0005895324
MSEKDIWKWLIPKLSDTSVSYIYKESKLSCKGFRTNTPSDIKANRKRLIANLLTITNLRKLSLWIRKSYPKNLMNETLKEKSFDELKESIKKNGLPAVLIKLISEDEEEKAGQLLENLQIEESELLNVPESLFEIEQSEEKVEKTEKSEKSKATIDDEEVNSLKAELSSANNRIKKLENKMEKLEADFEKKEENYKKRVEVSENKNKELSKKVKEREQLNDKFEKDIAKLQDELKKAIKTTEVTQKKLVHEQEEREKERRELEARYSKDKENLELEHKLEKEEWKKDKEELEELAELYNQELQDLKTKKQEKTETVKEIAASEDVTYEVNETNLREVKTIKEVLIIGKPPFTKQIENDKFKLQYLESDEIENFLFPSNFDEYWIVKNELRPGYEILLAHNDSFGLIDKKQVMNYTNFVEVMNRIENTN